MTTDIEKLKELCAKLKPHNEMSNSELSEALIQAANVLTRDDLSREDLQGLWQEAVYDASKIVQKLQQWIALANTFQPELVDHPAVQEAVSVFSDMKSTVWFDMESIYPSAIMRERPEAEVPEAAPAPEMPETQEVLPEAQAPEAAPSVPVQAPAVPPTK